MIPKRTHDIGFFVKEHIFISPFFFWNDGLYLAIVSILSLYLNIALLLVKLIQEHGELNCIYLEKGYLIL